MSPNTTPCRAPARRLNASASAHLSLASSPRDSSARGRTREDERARSSDANGFGGGSLGTMTPMVLGEFGNASSFLQHENHATPHLDLRWVTARSMNASRLSPSHDFGKRVRIDSVNFLRRVLPSRQCSVSSMGVALRSIGESGVGSSSADSHRRNRSASFFISSKTSSPTTSATSFSSPSAKSGCHPMPTSGWRCASSCRLPRAKNPSV